MTKIANGSSNGSAVNGAPKLIAAIAGSVIKPIEPSKPEKQTEDKKPEPEPKREMTLKEKIMLVENLKLVVEKREKLVETRSELNKFQIASNDFNCQLTLKDSDGHVFQTTFTPGIKKVVEFLKTAFESSIKEVEDQITF